MQQYQPQFVMPAAVENEVQLHPRHYASFEVKPLSGSIGAELTGIDLSRVDDDVFAEVNQALLDHLVITFPDQDLRPEDQLALARRFGTLIDYPFAQSVDGHSELTELRFEPGDQFNFGAGWHTDSMNFVRPPAITMTYCTVAPRVGGDTSYANLYLAWEALSDGMKDLLRDRKAVAATAMAYGSAAAVSAEEWRENTATPTKLRRDQEDEEFEHPIARTHPETGRIAIYTCYHYNPRFVGMTQEESLPLLRYLWDLSTRPEFTCRVTPREGSLTIWDNRCCTHYAHNDYPGQRRVLHRVIVEGDRPV